MNTKIHICLVNRYSLIGDVIVWGMHIYFYTVKAKIHFVYEIFHIKSDGVKMEHQKVRGKSGTPQIIYKISTQSI